MILLIVLVLIINLIALLVPKRQTKIEMFSVGMFAILFAVLTDIFLTLKFHLYWYFVPEVNAKALIPVFGLKAQMAILFINYFPLSSPLYKKIIYMLGWSVFSVVFEWVTVYIAGILHYNGWTIWHSVLAYPIILTVIILVFYYVRCLIKNNKWV